METDRNVTRSPWRWEIRSERHMAFRLLLAALSAVVLVGFGVSAVAAAWTSNGALSKNAVTHAPLGKVVSLRGRVVSVTAPNFTFQSKDSGPSALPSNNDVLTSPETDYMVITTKSPSAIVSGNTVVFHGTKEPNGSITAISIAVIPKPLTSTEGRDVGTVMSNTTGVLTVTVNGSSERVSTASTTTVRVVSTGSFGDLSKGTSVDVSGTWARVSGQREMLAQWVTILPATTMSVHVPPPVPPRKHHPTGIPSPNNVPKYVTGVVGSIGTASFVVTETNGTAFPVATNITTAFTSTNIAAPSAALPGTFVIAIGARSTKGSFQATSLAIYATLPPVPSAPPWKNPPLRWQGVSRVHTCASPTVVAGTVSANTDGTLTINAGGGPTMVVTSAATSVTQTVAGNFGELSDGGAVQVEGSPGSDGMIQALRVNIGVHLANFDDPPLQGNPSPVGWWGHTPGFRGGTHGRIEGEPSSAYPSSSKQTAGYMAVNAGESQKRAFLSGPSRGTANGLDQSNGSHSGQPGRAEARENGKGGGGWHGRG